ncbi:MAG: hypothetical protein RMJ44_06110 [Cytophagales bacterium]|nr:hypothetical protein [Bernardetiaceae bacterium]MDW8210643.1 hypothetical protein [Cytophagales bacterium]
MSSQEDELEGNDFGVYPNGRVYYDATTDAVVVQLIGYCPSALYRLIMNHAIKLLKAHKTSKMLGNTQQSEVIFPEDQDWTNQNWAPRAIESGLRYNAIVLSEDLYGRLAVEQITESAKVVQVKYFKSVEQAQRWLKKVG